MECHGGMPRTRIRLKQQAEKRFLHKIDVPVPPDGIGLRLDAMLAWCRAHVARGFWDCHGHRVRSSDDGWQKFARFYFADAPIAAAFKREWL
jgi:hypothetical protein